MIGNISNLEIGSAVRTKLNAAIDKVNQHCEPAIYRALLNQSGGSAPTATVLTNTLGGTVVWSRTSAGSYAASLAGAFNANKTFLVLCHPTAVVFRLDANTVDLTTGGADDLLGDTSLEILVYP